jgi:anti-anti-sigma factor
VKTAASRGAEVWRLTVTPVGPAESGQFAVKGRLGMTGAAELDAALSPAGQETCLELLLDLQNVDYLSSPGIRVLDRRASELESRGGRLLVRNATDPVRLALELAGLERLIEAGDVI